jgi:EmrB/QacA subfamily drug resistance transporter
LAIICTILFLTFLDNTIVSVVLSGVQTNLNAGVQALQWIVDGYMLAFAALMLTGGTLGDIFGRKKIMLGGVALFSAGSVVAMLAPSSGILTIGRVIMGIGAAASEPGTLSMIRHIYPERKSRARALGVWAAVSGVALAFGPIIGGIITGFTSWRGIFAFNLVVGLLVFIVGLKMLPESADPSGRHLDIGGLIIGTAALAVVTFAVIQGESSGYRTWWIDLLFALSLLGGGLFILWESRSRDPVLKLDFFRKPAFAGANFVALATSFGVFAIFFFTALYLAIVVGFSGYDIALAFIAMAATMMLATYITGRWVSKSGPALPMVVGCIVASIGIFAVDAVLKPSVGTVTLAWPLAIVGFGFGMTLVTATSMVLTIVPAERSGMAASTFNTFRELGGVFGVAILGTIVNGQLTSQLVQKLQALGLPHDFQSLVIYAITHGGNLPANSHVSAGAVLSHPQLVQQVTDATYQAFGNGLDIALRLAGVIMLIAAAASALTMRQSATKLQFSVEGE